MKLTEPSDAFSLAESFSDYIQKVYAEPPSKESAQELKMAFYAGAYHVRSVVEVARTMPKAMAKPIMVRLDDEIIGYLHDLIKTEKQEAKP